MAYLLHIDTSTHICSVALSNNNELLTYKTVADRNVHSELLTTFIQEILIDSNISLKELSAVSISEGPGSFTGLRIGVSVAKGICFGLGIPLISVNTLKSLVNGLDSSDKNANNLICSLIDARNNEVYFTVYDHLLSEILPIQVGGMPWEVFDSFDDTKNIVFIGDEVEKWAGRFGDNERVVLKYNVLPDARNLVNLAFQKFESKEFAELTFFEPLYLKDFKAKVGTKIKKILNI